MAYLGAIVTISLFMIGVIYQAGRTIRAIEQLEKRQTELCAEVKELARKVEDLKDVRRLRRK